MPFCAARRSRCVWLLAAGILGAVTAAGAQRVSGTIVLADSTTPAAGAIVEAITGSGTLAARTLASQRGEFAVDVGAPGRYSVRILRIGFRPTIIADIDVVAGATRTLRAVLTADAIVLSAVSVQGRQQCRIRPDSGQLVARVWEEARKALIASRIAARDSPLYAEWIKYERHTDPTGLRVREQSITTTRALTTSAFRSAPVDSLLTTGFVVDAGDGAIYHAPDADVLLSDAFAATHCLRLEPPAAGNERLVGVGFEPARDRNRIPDISGTFWVDRISAELRTLDFRYTGIPEVLRDAGVGGHVEFLRLASGEWLINRWHVRMVQVTTSRGTTRVGNLTLRDGGTELHTVVLAGGDVTSVLRGDSVLYTAPFPDLVVRVTSSDPLVPVARAAVTLGGTDYVSTADATGLVRISRVLPGTYRMAVHTPLLDATLATPPTRDVDLAANVTRVDTVALPVARDIVRDACGRGALTGARSLLYGFVQDTLGRGVPRAPVSVSWLARATVVRGSVIASGLGVATITDAAGRWHLCDVERGLVTVRSETDIGRDAQPVRLVDADLIRPIDLELRGDNAIVAGAALSLLEVIATGPGGAPIPGVSLDVTGPSGVTRRATTSDQGLALVTGVEPGLVRVRTRKIGYLAGELIVRAEPGRNTVPIRLDASRQPELDTVRVVGSRMIDSRLDGFETRRARGFGAFMSRAQIEQRGATTAIELLRGMPGVVIRGGGGHDVPISSRGSQSVMGEDGNFGMSYGCRMAIYIDGTLRTGEWLADAIRPSDIEGIEVYAGTAEIPAQFKAGNNGCGAILIWSRSR